MNPLDYFFTPKSIAVVGASSDPAKPGYALLKNIISYGFKGDIFPINPAGGKVLGKKVYSSLSAVNKKIDLAIMIIPNQVLESAITEASRCVIKNIIIISAGFDEEGTEGKIRSERLRKIMQPADIRLIGPNCMGVYDVTNHLNATHFQNLPRIKGNISLVSQSGAYGGILFSAFRERNIGLNKFISIGNQIDINHTEMLEYLGQDSSTQVIALFIEGLKDGRRFLETAQRVARVKPIVAFKAGRTVSGNRAALSHTGSMAGEYSVYRAAFKQAGIILAEHTDEFFDILTVFSLQHHLLPRNPARTGGVGIVTISGGPAVVAADTCEEMSISVPRLNKKTTNKLRRYLPSFGAVNNPVDMTPQTAPKNYLACLEAICQDPNISGLIAINVNLDFPEFGNALLKVQDKFRFPIVSVLIDNPKIERLIRPRIPVFPTPERAVRAYRGLLMYEQIRNKLTFRLLRRSTPRNDKPSGVIASPDLSGRSNLVRRKSCLTEHEAKKVLKEYGIPTTREILCQDESAVLKAAKKIGYPIVLKIASPKILHKSDVGGVILNILDSKRLQESIKSLRSFPLLVQEMIKDGQEVIIGGRRDETFGPVIIFGLGGIFTELLKDFSIRVCPVTKMDVKEMIEEIRGNQILKGYRGKEKVNLDAIINTIIKVSNLLLNNTQIKEFDINPAIVDSKRLVVVDARVILFS